MLVRDGEVAWLGDWPATRPRPTSTVDLGDALITPAFVDAHVHATDTGLAMLGLDLSGRAFAAGSCSTRSRRSRRHGAAAVSCSATASTSRRGVAEQTPPTERRAGPGRGRAQRLPVPGIDPLRARLQRPAGARRRTRRATTTSGWVRRDAHHVVREAGLRPDHPARSGTRRSARRCGQAASLGIAAVHECGGPGTSSRGGLHGAARASPARVCRRCTASGAS